MASQTKTPSLLVDRYGKSLAISSYSSQTRKLNNPAYINYRAMSTGNNNDPYKFLNPSERRLINQFALDLFRSSPTIHSAINKKNEWACSTAWKPIYNGANASWGKLASEYLNNVAYPNCSIAGPNMTFNRLLLTIANQIDIAGDILVTFVQTRDGIGRMQLYASPMVGDRSYNKAEVTDGRYKGAQIDDGVILNSSDTPIAYRILQENKLDDFDVSTRDASLVMEPTDLCNRGLSALGPSLLTYLSVEDITQALNQTVHNQSKQQFVVSTENGSGDEYVAEDSLDADLTVTPQASTNFVPHVVNLGPVAFVNAKNGEKIEAFKGEAPHMNSQEWIRYLSETVVYDLGWALPLISPEKLTGANAKMIESQVQSTISTRQATLKRVAQTYTLFALARAMENGDLPKLSNADWRQWAWSMPAEFVINSTDADDIAGWSAGTKTLQEISARNASDWVMTRNQRQIELEDAFVRADILVTKSGGKISFERALTLIGTGAGPQVSPMAEQTITTSTK